MRGSEEPDDSLNTFIQTMEKKEANNCMADLENAYRAVPPMGNMTSLTSLHYNQMEDGFDSKTRGLFKQQLADPTLGHGDSFFQYSRGGMPQSTTI